jgi:hypothetical protein
VKTKLIFIFFVLFTVSISAVLPALSDNAPRIVEQTKTVINTVIRIQVSLAPGQDEASAKAVIDKAFKSAIACPADSSAGYIIETIVSSLKESGVKNAFVNSDEEIYSLGQKSDKEMWKAWIPHPTDKKKVFAILRLKDKAIATVHNDAMSASVVADTTLDAEKRAKDLLAKGEDGLKAADEMGLDALLIIKEKNKFRTGMAGGFKEQYGKAKGK